MNIVLYRCNICHENKPQQEMAKRKNAKPIRCLDCTRAKSRQYHEEHKDRRNAARNQWYATYRDYSKKESLRRDAESPEKRVNRILRFKARQRGFADPIINDDITLHKLMVMCRGVCCVCGKPIDPDSNERAMHPTIEHIVPISKGGKHEWANVAVSHHACNARKYNKIIKKEHLFLPPILASY